MKQTVSLNSGTDMPILGLGLWRVKEEQECARVVNWALAAGYTHFDTAQLYGNESYLGSAFKDADVKREDLFITTKIKNNNQWWVDLIPSFEESLQNLQMEYADLLLLHFPVTELRRPAWRRMEELAASGRAKAIGVSNYTIRYLEELLRECAIKPAVNQVELHVYLQQPELVQYCKDHDIVVEAYSPLAHGHGLDNPTLAAIGKKYGKSPAQIMIRWCLEAGTVPLPKSVHEDRLKENCDVFDFELDVDGMTQLKQLDTGYRTAWDPTHVA
jgi:methylglyoxal/glyoxal reductase